MNFNELGCDTQQGNFHQNTTFVTSKLVGNRRYSQTNQQLRTVVNKIECVISGLASNLAPHIIAGSRLQAAKGLRAAQSELARKMHSMSDLSWTKHDTDLDERMFRSYRELRNVHEELSSVANFLASTFYLEDSDVNELIEKLRNLVEVLRKLSDTSNTPDSSARAPASLARNALNTKGSVASTHRQQNHATQLSRAQIIDTSMVQKTPGTNAQSQPDRQAILADTRQELYRQIETVEKVLAQSLDPRDRTPELRASGGPDLLASVNRLRADRGKLYPLGMVHRDCDNPTRTHLYYRLMMLELRLTAAGRRLIRSQWDGGRTPDLGGPTELQSIAVQLHNLRTAFERLDAGHNGVVPLSTSVHPAKKTSVPMTSRTMPSAPAVSNVRHNLNSTAPTCSMKRTVLCDEPTARTIYERQTEQRKAAKTKIEELRVRLRKRPDSERLNLCSGGNFGGKLV